MNNYINEIGHLFLKIYNDNQLDVGEKGHYFDLMKMLADQSIDCLIEEKHAPEFKNKLIDSLHSKDRYSYE